MPQCNRYLCGARRACYPGSKEAERQSIFIRASAPNEKHVWDLETLDELVRIYGRELRAEAHDVSPVS